MTDAANRNMTFMEAFGKKADNADAKEMPKGKPGEEKAAASGKPADNSAPTDSKQAPTDKSAGKKPPFGKKAPTDSKAPAGKVGASSGPDTDMASGKATKPEIKDKVKVQFNPEIQEEVIAALDFISEGNLADVESEILDEFKEEFLPLLTELSIAARMKKRLVMKRFKRKIELRRSRALARRASESTIGKRARRAAVSTLKQRFAGGRTTEDMSVADKDRVERMVKQRQGLVARLTNRLKRSERQIDRERLNGK